MTSLLFVAGCASTIAVYDSKSYENATSLKVETLALMDKGADPYEQHSTEVADLRLRLQKAEEYARGLDKNAVAVSMWETLANEGGMLDRFFKEWQVNPVTPPTYLNDKKEQVAKAFDKLIQLEARKVKTESGR
jgi:trans-aconitate methyltransferase